MGVTFNCTDVQCAHTCARICVWRKIARKSQRCAYFQNTPSHAGVEKIIVLCLFSEQKIIFFYLFSYYFKQIIICSPVCIFKTLQVMPLIVHRVQPEDTLIIHSLISLHTLIMIDKRTMHLFAAAPLRLTYSFFEGDDNTMQVSAPHTCNAKGNRNLYPVNQEYLDSAIMMMMTMTKMPTMTTKVQIVRV